MSYHKENKEYKNYKKNINFYNCKICNKEANVLHHIKYNPPKVIPLCHSCHKKVHMIQKNKKHYENDLTIGPLKDLIPLDKPYSISFAVTPEDVKYIEKLDITKSRSQNLRNIVAFHKKIKTRKFELKIKLLNFNIQISKVFL